MLKRHARLKGAQVIHIHLNGPPSLQTRHRTTEYKVKGLYTKTRRSSMDDVGYGQKEMEGFGDSLYLG